MSSCIVNFDNFQGHYYAGGTITGRVICSFTESKNVRGIKLYLKGAEHNQWTETESYYDSEEKRHKNKLVQYSGDNKFLFLEKTLCGSGDIGPGRLEYPFSLELPRNIPGTYIGKYGGIKFSIKAKVDRPYKFDYEDEKEFNVVSPIDFNEIKNKLTLDPVTYSDEKTICCWCCASGPISFDVSLEKEAFIQGEVVNVKVDITNMANENIERVDVKLDTTVKSRVKLPSSKSKTDYELLAAANDTGVGAHGDRTYHFQLEIPKSTVVPNFSLCTLFEQWSTLHVTAVIDGCHSNMDIYTNIKLGHIPIGGQLQQSGYPEYPPQNNAFQTAGAPYPPQHLPYPSGSPPPYPPGGNPAPYPPAGNPALYPGGTPAPYPPSGNPAPYPPSSVPYPYSPSAIQVPYPAPFPTPSPSSTFPMQQQQNPAPDGGLGFVKHPEFPSLPSGPAPYSSGAGPSAPPLKNVASAASKTEKTGDDFVMVEPTAPLSGKTQNPDLPPPSYNDVMFNSPK